ncbi:MAG: von Willebrand factor type A domain-containing protein [Bacteroidales bacterium]|nr:von Willebrand factor type A domain-containing protein [Bacteroidales bacterium]
MKNLISTIGVLLISSFITISAQTGMISGLITDNSTSKAIPGAKIQVFQNGKVVAEKVSSANGAYALSVDVGKYDIKALVSGYEVSVKKNIDVNANSTTRVNFALNPIQLVEIVKEEERSAKLSKMMIVAECSAPVSFAGGIAYDYDATENFNTESYDVINENIFKDVRNNPLSTFSVDVDRASYSNVRRFLTQSQKPVKDAVRIEELINYFDYDYPQPKNGHPFSITIEADKCPWNTKHQLFLVGLKGENINENEIPANNLTFLIDVSGSMSSANKLPLLKQAFKYLVENLRPQDRVAIVVYAGAAGVVLESTPGNQKEKIIAALDMLQAGGSTAGGEGINLAYKIAKQNFIKNGNNRVILASDGDFNVGASSDAEMVRLIEQKRNDGIFLSILGFGMGNYKDSKMEQISNAGNGNYAYIDNILEAKKVFGTELWGTLYTIAKDVKIQIEFNPTKVKAYRLIGYENRILNKEDFNNDKKDAGDIGCGHTVTALYEVIPADSNEEVSNVDQLEYQKQSTVNSKNLMTVKVRYKKPNEDTSNLIVEKVEAGKTESTNNLMFASAVAEFGMLLRESEFKGNTTFVDVLKRAKTSAGLDEYGYKADFIKMVEMGEMLYK